MDVYISEEYVVSRRRERKAAADARKRSEMELNSRREDKEEKTKSSQPSSFRFKELVSAGGFKSTEDIVFSCTSA